MSEKLQDSAEIYGVEMNNEFFFEVHFLCMQSVVFYPTWYFIRVMFYPAWYFLRIPILATFSITQKSLKIPSSLCMYSILEIFSQLCLLIVCVLFCFKEHGDQIRKYSKVFDILWRNNKTLKRSIIYLTNVLRKIISFLLTLKLTYQ